MSIREIAATSCRETKGRVVQNLLFYREGRGRDKYGRGDAGKTGSLIGQVKNDG